jgi:hypothetical protein
MLNLQTHSDRDSHHPVSPDGSYFGRFAALL